MQSVVERTDGRPGGRRKRSCRRRRRRVHLEGVVIVGGRGRRLPAVVVRPRRRAGRAEAEACGGRSGRCGGGGCSTGGRRCGWTTCGGRGGGGLCRRLWLFFDLVDGIRFGAALLIG